MVCSPGAFAMMVCSAFRFLLPLLLAAGTARAQTFTPDPVDIDAARREGSLSWYTSTPVDLAQQLIDAFQKETGIKVQLLRTGGQAVLRRILPEIAAGQPGADIITMSDAGAANGMAKQGQLVAFRPAGFDKLLDVAKDPQGRWIAQRLQLAGIAVRTDKVAPADLPKTWSDLTKPKYKGQMVMPDPSFTAIQLGVVAMLSQKLGWDFYKALRANDTMIVQGHQQVFSTMQSGERVIGAEGSDPRSFSHGQDVPNQTIVYPTEGAFFVSSPTAILKDAKSPNAAKLFARFMISSAAQKIIAASGIHAVLPSVAPPPGMPALSAIKALPIDLDFVEEHNRDLKARFNEIFQ
jgi:iron(III) transport system substrate-binding protein